MFWRLLPVLFVLTVAPAIGQTPAEDVSGGFGAVRAGLAHEMKASADALESGNRHHATKALDRALHLAEFATTAFVLPDNSGPFHDAHEAVKDARHALQMGRPEEAARILAAAAEAMAGAPLPDLPAAGLTLDQADLVEGRFVLNATGHRLGELNGIVPSADGNAMAIVGQGGWGGIGEVEIEIPVNLLLGSEHYIVLPTDVSPEEFASGAG